MNDDWFKDSEIWEDCDKDISFFNNHTNIGSGNSLHVYHEEYEIEGDRYRIYWSLNGNDLLGIEKLKK